MTGRTFVPYVLERKLVRRPTHRPPMPQRIFADLATIVGDDFFGALGRLGYTTSAQDGQLCSGLLHFEMRARSTCFDVGMTTHGKELVARVPIVNRAARANPLRHQGIDDTFVQ